MKITEFIMLFQESEADKACCKIFFSTFLLSVTVQTSYITHICLTNHVQVDYLTSDRHLHGNTFPVCNI